MFGDQLKKARTAKGYTLEQLANIYNREFDGKLSKGTLSKYENNKQEPMISVVNNLSVVLDVTTDFLLSKNEVKNTKDTPTPDTIDVTKLKNYVPYNPVKVPFLGEIACGEPIYANQEYDSYVITDEGIHADFCIRAKGDSMINAGIDEGDIVFIRRQSYIDNGSIASVAIDDTVTLKRFYQSDTTVTLVAENPAYPPIIHDFSDGKSIYILGKAVAVQKPLAPAGKVKPKEEIKPQYIESKVAARGGGVMTHIMTKEELEKADAETTEFEGFDELQKFDLDD